MLEITCLLYLYDAVVSDKVKRYGLEELDTFLHGRAIEKAKMFKKNQILTSRYHFLEKAVQSLKDHN